MFDEIKCPRGLYRERFGLPTYITVACGCLGCSSVSAMSANRSPVSFRGAYVVVLCGDGPRTRSCVRARDAVERGIHEGKGITPEELLKHMDDRIDATVLRLSRSER